jgi:hypothetical protein
MVATIGHRNRKVLRTDFRRLCEECANALGRPLTAPPPVVVVHPGPWAAKAS